MNIFVMDLFCRQNIHKRKKKKNAFSICYLIPLQILSGQLDPIHHFKMGLEVHLN